MFNKEKNNNDRGLTTDRNDPDLHKVEFDGQYKKYLVLSEEERKKGFVQPYRDRYVCKTCGALTIMGRELSETYARNPNFYNATYCTGCNCHIPLMNEKNEYNFYWDIDGTGVGEITTEEQREISKKTTRVALEMGISVEQLIKQRKKNARDSIKQELLKFIDNLNNEENDEIKDNIINKINELMYLL